MNKQTNRKNTTFYKENTYNTPQIINNNHNHNLLSKMEEKSPHKSGKISHIHVIS
jgi:hypothetical protein